MSKWRAVLVGAMAAGALGAGLFIPAQAEEVETPVGSVLVEGDPTTQSGAIVVDGNGAVPGPVGGGYIGADSDQGVVACADGDYTGTDDNVITAIPPTGEEGAPDPNSPCSPKAP